MVRAKLEFELDFYRSARSRPDEAYRFPVAANRRHPVQRPRDSFENRRLAGTVRADDSSEPALELELGSRVLAEVGELETVESHATASSSVGPATRSASRR